MEILVRLAGVQLGPYSEQQVRQYLEEGLLSPTDMAKAGGTEEWIAVNELLAKLPPTSDAPASEPEPETASQSPRRASDMAPNAGRLPPKPDDKKKTSRPSLLNVAGRNTSPLPSAAPAFRSTVMPSSPREVSPAAAAPKVEETKKVSRLIQVRSLAQNTAPLSSAPISAARAPAHPSFPTTPAAGDPAASSHDTEKMSVTALAKALAKKTVPMRSAPPLPEPSTGPAGTTIIPRNAPMKPATGGLPPPSEAKALTKQLGRLTPGEVNAQTSPPTLGLTVGANQVAAPGKTDGAETSPSAGGKANGTSNAERPRRLFPALICAWAALALLMVYYVWSPYHAVSSLQAALSNGDQARLEKLIDFPALQASLKEQIRTQAARSELSNQKAQPSGGQALAGLLSIMDNSIDLYLTPSGLSTLITDAGAFAKPEAASPIVLSETAATILREFNSLPVRNEGLVSPGDFVVNNDLTLLHLRFDGLGWKVTRIDLRPDLFLPVQPAFPGASIDATPPLFSPVVDTYVEQAAAKSKRGDWDGAIDDLTHVLVINPQSSVAYANRASARQSKGDMDGAIADYTHALDLDPKLSSAYASRGDARSAKGDANGAMSDYSRALELDPKLGTVYFSRGNARTSVQNWEGAIADYSAALALDPNMAKAYGNRGFARQSNGNLDGAITDYTQALSLDPKVAVTYYNRGFALETQGSLDAALSDFNEAIKRDPKLGLAYYERGNIKNSRNDVEGAVADYSQAIALKPELAPAYSKRGADRQAQGDLDGALADYNQALNLDPKNAPAYYQRGLIKQQRNDLDGAIADSSQALDLDPKNAQAWYNRGFAKLAKGNLDGALADLKQFCDLAPKDPNADNARLYLWLIAKAQSPKADPDQELSDALQDNWNSDPNDLASKSAAFLLGRIKEADYLAAAASSDPAKDADQHCKAWYFAGMKRLLAGDKKNALDAFHKCVATGQTDHVECILAQAEIQTLTPAPASNPLPTPAAETGPPKAP